MVAVLTNDQLAMLRLARGDALLKSRYERPATRVQDRRLLVEWRLLEQQGAEFVLTEVGAAYLRSVEGEIAAGRWKALGVHDEER